MKEESSSVREKILKAAKKVFTRYGYKKSSVSIIAKMSGNAKSSLYHYFNDKESIFVAVVKNDFDLIIRKSFLKSISKRSPIEKLRAYIFSSLENLGTMLNEYEDKILTDSFEFLPLIGELIKNNVEIHTELIKNIIDEGIKKEIFQTENSSETAVVFGHAFLGFSKDSPLYDIFQVNEKITEKLFQMLISGLTTKKGM